MDTYNKSLSGSRSRASGEYFEGMISAACRFYEEKGISVIEKEVSLFAALQSRHSQTLKAY